MDAKQLNLVSKRYCKYGLWLTTALTLLVILSVSVGWLEMKFITSVAICAVYTVVITFAYSLAWRRLGKVSSGMMTKFYLAAPAIRLITAALVVVSFCMLNKVKEDIRGFVLLFFVFYMMMLIFDCVFFARIERTNNLNVKK
jgi:hypothetical protein